MSTWFSRLESSLRANDKPFHAWPAGHGRLLITPHAARVVACELPGVKGNLFWHHPAMEDSARIGSQLKRAGGGLGGDRLWIGPEVGFNWPDLAVARIEANKTYTLPPEMDPADYRIAEELPGQLRLVTEMALTDHRLGKQISLRVNRQFNVIAAPPPEVMSKSIRHAGFAIRNEITLLGGDVGAVACAWDLLQVPPEGDIICPTVTPVRGPRSYYDPFGKRHVKSNRRFVKFHVDGKHRIKMGLAPTQTTGRMGYLRKVGKVTALIVRIFQPLPGEPYVDLPRASDALFGGDALQTYNDGGANGGFGEMEYHDPALVVGRPPHSRVGTCVTHVFAGPDAAIRKMGGILLGVKL